MDWFADAAASPLQTGRDLINRSCSTAQSSIPRDAPGLSACVGGKGDETKLSAQLENVSHSMHDAVTALSSNRLIQGVWRTSIVSISFLLLLDFTIWVAPSKSKHIHLFYYIKAKIFKYNVVWLIDWPLPGLLLEMSIIVIYSAVVILTSSQHGTSKDSSYLILSYLNLSCLVSFHPILMKSNAIFVKTKFVVTWINVQPLSFCLITASTDKA